MYMKEIKKAKLMKEHKSDVISF